MNNSKKPCDLKNVDAVMAQERKDGHRPSHLMGFHTKDSGFGFPDVSSLGPGDRHTYALKCTICTCIQNRHWYNSNLVPNGLKPA